MLPLQVASATVKNDANFATEKSLRFTEKFFIDVQMPRDSTIGSLQCSSGHRSLASIEIDFYNSKERRTLCTRKVTEFYRKVLHRNPDPLGLDHHVFRCTAGKTSLSLIEANFYNSVERRKLCHGKIIGFYHKILHRQSDTPGLNYWVLPQNSSSTIRHSGTKEVSITTLADAREDVEASI